MKEPNKEKFEKCVLCGKLTGVPISMPIDWREDYELGCGQLCSACRQKMRKTADEEDILSHTQVLKALEQSRNNKQ